MVNWADIPKEERARVLDVLAREAERLENDAIKMQTAAQQLGRPSLVERQELSANAFRAAMALLMRS